ncbi:hypothetical protein D9M72_297920 [compost metagenome]
MLADDHLGHARLLRLLVVVVVAVDEHDDVRVLLDGAGFAQVAHHGALVGTRFHAAAELRQRDHRALQFLGQHLQAARDFAHGRGAVLVARAAGGHELQVVDHDQAQAPVLARQPARIGAQLAGRKTRRLVDVQRHRAQLLDGLGQARPLFVAELAGAQVALVDAADGTHDTHRQLGGAHFHREHRHRQPLFERHVLGDVDRQRGLAHRRTRGQHDHVARLQARGHLVEVVEARAHARDVVRVLGHLGHAVEQLDHQGIHALEALLHPRAFFADVEDLLLGFVQDLVDRLALRIEGVGGDLVGGGHELAQDGALAHDLGVAPDVARARHVLRERVQVDQPADVVGLAEVLQLLEDRDHVGRLAGIDQPADGRVDQLVLMAVEVAVDQQVAHAVPGAVVQQQAPQHTGFGLDGMRRNAQLRDLAVGRRIIVGIGENGGHGLPLQPCMLSRAGRGVCGQGC